MSRSPLCLTYEMYIAAPPERVWEALTDGSITSKYFYGTEVRSSFKRGADIAYTAGGMALVHGKILSVEKGRGLEISQSALWDPVVSADAPTRVSWELAPVGDATKLTLVHDGFERETETLKQSSAGWPVILSGLKSVVETGRPLTLPAQG